MGVSGSEQPRVVTSSARGARLAADHSTDGWRIVALAEATLLAICAAGTVLTRRRRGSQLSA